MKEDKVLDELFSFNEEDLVKAAKRKSMGKIISISIGMSVLSIVLIVGLKLQVTPIILDKQASEISYYYEMYGANIFISKFGGGTNITNSRRYANKYKIINNTPVIMGEVEVPYTKYEDVFYMSNGEVFSESGYRMMQFFHPNIEYTNYKKDLGRLDELKAEDVVELGISLDNKYSFEELKKMLPETVELNWCWVDTVDEQLFNIDKEFFNSDYEIFYEDSIMGFSTIQGNGAFKEDPVGEFIESFDLIIPKTKKHKAELIAVTNELSDETGIIDPEGVPIIGAVVVGSVKELKKLEELPQIKASSFGVILK